MAFLFVLNTLDNRRAIKDGFDNKKQAKQVRDQLIKDGTRCVVSRGPDHLLGPSHVDQACLNTERTSRRKNKRSPL